MMHHFTKRGGLAPYTSLTSTLFFLVLVPSQEGEWSYIFVLGVSITWILDSSDSVLFVISFNVVCIIYFHDLA